MNARPIQQRIEEIAEHRRGCRFERISDVVRIGESIRYEESAAFFLWLFFPVLRGRRFGEVNDCLLYVAEDICLKRRQGASDFRRVPTDPNWVSAGSQNAGHFAQRASQIVGYRYGELGFWPAIHHIDR